MIEIRVLGRFTARRDGEEIPPAAFRQRLVRTLLRMLVSRRGAFVSRDVLVEALWPGRPPADPAMNLKVLVRRARQALGDASLIATGPGGYCLAEGPGCVVDAEVFLEHVATGRAHLAAHRAAGALVAYRSALQRWAGDPLSEDAYEDWAQDYRSRLARAHLDALEGAAEASLSLRDPGEAVGFAERAVLDSPLREASTLLLTRSLAAAGDAASALAVLDGFRRRLADELGLDASSAASELEVRILRGERLGPDLVPRMAPPAEPDDLPFVGREAEVATLLAWMGAPAPGVMVVAGPPGGGKSRLLAEAAVRADLPVLRVRAFLPDLEESWSLAGSLLREVLELAPDAARAIPDRAAQALVDLVPVLEEIRPVRPVALDGESRRALVVEGAVRMVGAMAGPGAVVLIDDVQWMDAASGALIVQIMKRVPDLGVVVAHRTEDPAPSPLLTSLLADLRAVAPVRSISLDPLATDAVALLLPEEDLAVVVSSETDRTPLALREVIRDLSRRGAIERGPHGGWLRRSADAVELARTVSRLGKVRALRVRADRQPPGSRRLLTLLALLRREAPAGLLAAATGDGQSLVLAGLDGLARAGLVRLGEAGWSTAHDLVSDAVTEDLPSGERAALHHLLVRALRGAGADAAELASHLEAMGEHQDAAEALAQAARDRLARHEHGEAERLADAGLASEPRAGTRCSLFGVRAEARVHRGEFAGAQEDLQEALHGATDAFQRSRFLARLAALTSGADNYARAGELADLAIVEAGTDPSARAEALLVAATIDMNTGQWARAQVRADESEALFEQAGDAGGIARILDARALHTFFQGNIAEAAGMFARVVDLFQILGQLLRLREPRVYRAWALGCMGRAAEGLAEVDEALELERILGRPEGVAWCLWGRSEVLVGLGRADEALSDATKAVDIARRIGHKEWTTCALSGLGVAYDALGDARRAEEAFREVIERSGDMPIYASIGAVRLASLLARTGDPAEAAQYAALALRDGPALIAVHGRLAEAEIAAARADPDHAAIAKGALGFAEAHGMVGGPPYRRVHTLAARDATEPATGAGSG